jgi:hypothetical protein
MRTLLLGGIKTKVSSDGFIFLRNLLILFIVIISFAALTVSMAAVFRQTSRYAEYVQKEILSRNEIMLQRVR